MAYLNISGAETGDLSEASATSGTVSVSSAIKRTGSYSYRVNPTTSTAYIEFKKLAATGKATDIGADIWVTAYVYFATFPGSNERFISINGATALSNSVVDALIDNAGVVTIRGTSTSGTVTTLSLDTWYRIDIRGATSGTCGISVDGGAETTVTGNAQTCNIVAFGVFNRTMDCYYDDIAISNSAYPGAGEVRMSVPIGAGNYAGWSTGAYTDVDEVPHDSGTTVVVSGTGAGLLSATYDMQTAATAGIAGTIATVKLLAIMNEAASTTTQGGIRLRSATTDTDTTAVDIGSTTYVPIAFLWDTDPADAAAWTSTKYDAIEGGVFRAAADTSSIQATAIYAMAWCTGTPAAAGPLIGGKLLGGILRGRLVR